MVKFRRGDGASEHLEDRRGRGAGVAAGGGLIGLIALVVSLLGGGGGSGGTDLLDQLQGGAAGTVDPADQPLVEEMADALDDIQAFWAGEEGLGSRYEPATLVLFTDAVRTEGCGTAPSSVGPFYCPADAHAYLDLSFFRELDQRFRAPGDFARVYVLAHELGHHVQNLLGDSGRGEGNEASVRLELQADCYAGIWGHSAQDRGLIETGDLAEGLDAAAAVGDDRLQQQAGADVEPESWTHGSSAARQRWFRAGYDQGDLAACDTFAATADELGL